MSSPNELQLNLSKQCKGGNCACDIKLDGIITKEENLPSHPGFIRYTHERSKAFVLKRSLDRTYYLKNDIHGVISVSAYYWKDEPKSPLFLEVTRNGFSKKDYYYRHGDDEGHGTREWKENTNDHSLQERLDDRNCGLNKTIAFEIKRDVIATTEDTRSNCITQRRKITSVIDPPEPLGGNYRVKGYKIIRDGTKISRVTFEGENVNGIDISKNVVTEVRVYEWLYKFSIPLLIEFKKSKGSEWFENTSQASTTWKPVSGEGFYDYTGTTPTPKLTTKLEEVNCTVNGVVQIDVSQQPANAGSSTGQYCHDAHSVKPRIKVSDITLGTYGINLFDYKAYAHAPTGVGALEISSFVKGSSPIDLAKNLDFPLNNVTNVVVFMCEKDSENTPLLIYIPQAPDGKKWFKNNGAGWNAVDFSEAPKNGKNYLQILKLLDTMESPCGPKKVIVNIKERPKNGEDPTYTYPSGGIDIKLTKKEGISGKVPSGYIEYVHELPNGRKDFTLVAAQYGIVPIEGIGSHNSVTSVSIFYWAALETGRPEGQKGRPLLLKLAYHGGSTRWYENLGKSPTNPNTIWVYLCKDFVTEDKLKSLLDEANCRLNKAVVIDVSEKPEDDHGTKYYDRCNELPHAGLLDPGHSQRMKVEKAAKPIIGMYAVYDHILKANHGDKFHIVGFVNGETGSINIGDTPILEVSSVKVYMCGSVPLLLYIDSTFEYGKKWFKESHGTWTLVSESQLTTSSHDEILEVLDGIQSGCAPPSVAIDISVKTNGKDSSHYVSENFSNEEITIIRDVGRGNRDPPLNYDRYDHTVRNRTGSYFTLSGLRYAQNDIDVPDSKSIRAVTSVSVYYWSKLDNGKPLLVKVESRQQKSDPSIKSYKWYENTGGDTTNNTEWKVAEGSDDLSTDTGKLKKKLDLLNCKLNKAVVIDLSQTHNVHKYYDRCERQDLDPWHGNRIKIEDVTPSDKPPPKGLATYKAYSHVLNDAPVGGIFHIVGFKNGSTDGGTSITLPGGNGNGTPDSPIMDITKVIVYFCSLKSSEPLLIYYEQRKNNGEDEPIITYNWYRKPCRCATNWTRAGGSSFEGLIIEHNNATVVNILDELESPCRPPKVIINIAEGLAKTEESFVYEANFPDPGQQIEVKREQVGNSKYNVFRHEVKVNNGRDNFTVAGVDYRKNNIIPEFNRGIKGAKEISTYYWSPLGNKSDPLLIRVLKKKDVGDGNEIVWYENVSTDGKNLAWQKIDDERARKLSESKPLEDELERISSRTNKVAAIDLSRRPKETPDVTAAESTPQDASQDGTVRVKDVSKDEPYAGNLGDFVVYSYDVPEDVKRRIGGSGTFHITSMTNGDSDDIILPEITDKPLLDVSKIVVFNQSGGQEDTPRLCCIEYNTDKGLDRLWLASPGHAGGHWTVVGGARKPFNLCDLFGIKNILTSYFPSGDNSIFSIANGVTVCGGLLGCYALYCILTGSFKCLRRKF